MPKTRNVYQEGTKIKSMCRVCLTHSHNIMFKLTDNLKNDNLDAESYLEALEKITFTKVELNGKFPESICPVCVSFLKMSLRFLSQFRDSQNRLQVMFKSSTPAYYDTSLVDEVQDIGNNLGKQNSNVELIIKNQKYSLNDIVVVEKEEPENHDYKGFIKKLGREISASIIKTPYEKIKIGNKMPILKREIHEELPKPSDMRAKCDEISDPVFKFDTLEIDEKTIYQEENIQINTYEDSINSGSQAEESENDGIIEYIIEEDGSNIDSEEQENITEYPHIIELEEQTEDTFFKKENEHYDSQSENEDHEYIKIAMLDKDDIESLIIDREKIGIEETFVQPKKRKRKRKLSENPRDEFEREVKFPCEICKKILSSAISLRNHVKRTHTEKNDKVFTCEVCGDICRTRSKFVNHKLQHVEKQFKCEQCDKTYSTKAHLKVHLSIHENRRPYLCNVCGKDFNYANALTYHLRLHTGEKNYHCEYCPKRFRMINSLNRHVRTHTGEKPYKCQYCGRCFSSKGEVVCHEYIHTGFRPYHCKYCKKGFSKTHNLKIHLLSHGGPYKCKFCTKTFIEQNILNMHHKISHKDLLAELPIDDEENSDSSTGDSEDDEAFKFEILDDESNFEYVEPKQEVEELLLTEITE